MTTSPEHRVKACYCPGCNEQLSGAASSNGAAVTPPDAGDFSVCAYCAMLLVFTAELDLRVLDRAEVEAIPADLREHLVETQDHIRRVRGLS